MDCLGISEDRFEKHFVSARSTTSVMINSISLAVRIIVNERNVVERQNLGVKHQQGCECGRELVLREALCDGVALTTSADQRQLPGSDAE